MEMEVWVLYSYGAFLLSIICALFSSSMIIYEGKPAQVEMGWEGLVVRRWALQKLCQTSKETSNGGTCQVVPSGLPHWHKRKMYNFRDLLNVCLVIFQCLQYRWRSALCSFLWKGPSLGVQFDYGYTGTCGNFWKWPHFELPKLLL